MDEGPEPRDGSGPSSVRRRWDPYRTFFGPVAVAFGVAVVIGAVLLPADGIGIPLCVLKWRTGLPCPGCGVTRSVCHTARGDLFGALALNPFGPLVLATAVTSASVPLWSARRRVRVRRWMRARARGIGRVYLPLVLALVVYGLVRLALVAADRWPMPY